MKKKIKNLLMDVPLEILVTAGVFLLSLLLFSFIVHEVVNEQENAFDNRVTQFFLMHRTVRLTETMKHITFFGSTTFLLPAYVVLVAWHLFKKKVHYAIDISVIALSSTGVLFALKEFFHRQRPQLPVIGIGGYSFPSGHTLSAFIFSAILIYLARKSNLRLYQKYILVILFLLFAVTIGISRLVLNVHYATDVTGSFCLGIVWVIVSFWIIKKIRKNTSPAGTGPV